METIQGPIKVHPIFAHPEPPEDNSRLAAWCGPASVPTGATQTWLLLDTMDGVSSLLEDAQGNSLGTLREFCGAEGVRLVGQSFSGKSPFPVCVRLRQINRDLPLQAFPESPTTFPNGDVKRPNYQFWHCLDALPQAAITAGIKSSVILSHILDKLTTPFSDGFLQTFPAQPHDSYMIPQGRLFCLSAGNLLFEVMQHPEEPMCISDPRKPVDPAAQQLALKAAQLYDRQLLRIPNDTRSIQRNQKIPLLRLCPFFQVDEIRLWDYLHDRTSPASFQLLFLLEGQARVETRTSGLDIAKLAPALLPACLGDYKLLAKDGHARLLRVQLNV